MSKVTKKKVIAVIRHYVYATAASALAIYLSGNHDVKSAALSAVSGVLGPVLGAVDPNNTNYGVGSSAS
jgi:energy-converting hydrogenase Eha subunit A